MLRKTFRKEIVSDDLLEEASKCTQLPKKELKKVIRKFLRDDSKNAEDVYSIILKSKEEGLYRERDRLLESFARLKCLVDIDNVSAKSYLATTEPPGNLIHALERLIRDSKLTIHDGKRAMLQFLLNCSMARATDHSKGRTSLVEMIESASHDISNQASIIARHAYFLLLPPEVVQEICTQEKFAVDDSTSIYSAVEARELGQANVAFFRTWKEIDRDEIQDIMQSGYGNTLEDAKCGCITRQLMRMYSVDRAHAASELKCHNGDIQRAGEACMAHAKKAERFLQLDPVAPTRDTQSAPNITANTRIISVLGLDEPSEDSIAASPSLGDGWMASDFYLWMHVLDGMGSKQQWISSMPPDYLINKYGKQDKVTLEETDEDSVKPVHTRWSTGFIYGDPFETRKIVLNESLLPQARAKLTIGPKGPELRNFFLQQLESTMAEASASGDRILVMMFSHGDYDSPGGLCIGLDMTSSYKDDQLLKPSHMASVFTKFPDVKTTIYMTSCYSGHWVETTEFQGRDLKPVVLAAARKSQESFGYAWSQSQRHAGGLFSSAAISELIKEPVCLSPEDISREYRELTTALVAEMNRLCLPVNIRTHYGSSPVFTDPTSQEKFWRRTGYQLYDYKANYDKLPTAPPSDPHPKRDRKKFEAEFIDGDHPDIVAWKARHPNVFDEDFPEATGGYGRTRRGLLSSSTIRYLICQYLQSKPGSHTMEHRLLMQLIREFHHSSMTDNRKLHLRRLLISRLQMNKQANEDAKLLGLYRLSNIEEWTVGQTSANYDSTTFDDF